MNYIEVAISFEPLSNEGREIFAAMLSQIGFDSFSDTKQGINAYIPDNLFSQESFDECLEPVIPSFELFQYTIQSIEAQNWNETWEKNFEPITVNSQCRIKAPFHQLTDRYTYDLIIEPKMSFGTGHHATTVLMLKLMLELNFDNKTVLDMGCGTGVLGILASLKNAHAVLGIDVDTWSYENTLENAARNQVSNFDALLGDASNLVGKNFDIVLANINRNILLNDMEIYVNSIKPEGQLLLSGFYNQDLPIIADKAKQLGLDYIKHLKQENWVAVQFIKNA
jgi:ribosomal protein L11 methyltransferase